MGFFRFVQRQIIGEDGQEFIDRYHLCYSDIEKYKSKSIRTVSEYRKLQLEQRKLWIDPKRKIDNIVNCLHQECTYTNKVGTKWATLNHLSEPTEEHYNILFGFSILEQKNGIDKFDIFDILKYKGEVPIHCLYVNRKELSEIILVLGGKKHQQIDEFKPVGILDFYIESLIRKYNGIEDEEQDEDEDEIDDFSELKNAKNQEVYSNGTKYISIWLFKKKYGIAPNTNEDNYINSEEIFYKYPSLETIEIEIDNRNFEYVLGYPEKTLIEYFNV